MTSEPPKLLKRPVELLKCISVPGLQKRDITEIALLDLTQTGPNTSYR
jgi:hypothetical protein